MQRALEVYRITGISLTQMHQGQGESEAASGEGEDAFLQIAIAPATRELLHQRIAQRFDAMLAAGFIDEVRTLLNQHQYSTALPAMKAVGYRQVCDYLAGDLSEKEMRERGIIATRQFAKRQLTWLRGWSNLEWLQPNKEDYAGDLTGTRKTVTSPGDERAIFGQALQILHKSEILMR